MAAAVAAGSFASSAAPPAGGKIAVTTADDMPRHTYDIKGSATALIKDDVAIRALAARLKADAEADLAAYDIRDRAVLEGYHRMLQQIDVIDGRYDEAIARIATIRDLQTREEERLMSGFGLRSHVAALKAARAADGVIDRAKYDAAFKASLRDLIRPLPLETIRERMRKGRAQAQMISREAIESALDVQLNPLIDANPGAVPAEIASALVVNRFLLDVGIDVARLTGEVFGEFLDGEVGAAGNPGAVGVGATGTVMAKVDVWTPTLVTLEPTAPGKAVAVAVWDTGVDTSLFPTQLWTNPRESKNGVDDDANGFVDDVHGIAFTREHEPAAGDLYPLDGLKSDKDTLMGYVAGAMDMQSGDMTPAAQALQKHAVALRGKAIEDFGDDMGIIGNYAHGTHVAGIIAEGNPFVRLLPIRETFDYKSIPDHAPTAEEYARWARSAQQAVDYARAAGVRVVNMSWRIPRAAVEAQLAVKGVGGTAAERAELSRKIFTAFRDGLERAIRSAPDILFVAGSGNEDNDADFSEYVPAGLRLPNLLTVGAVDAYGRPTNFTTTGKHIDLYANGYQVESFVPGGARLKFSGTSMASPQVANLAAKLLAMRPTLTVAQAIELIRKGAVPLPGQEGKFIINPAASMKLLER